MINFSLNNQHISVHFITARLSTLVFAVEAQVKQKKFREQEGIHKGQVKQWGDEIHIL